MARLRLDDGYTLDATTGPVAGVAVAFTYRPALPKALAEYRKALYRAETGEAEVAATAALLAGHVTAWDVHDADGRPVPVSPAAVGKVPEPILDRIVKAVASWAPKADAAAGN